MPSLTKQLRTLSLLALTTCLPAQVEEGVDKLLEGLPDNTIAWAAIDDLPAYYEELLQAIGPMPKDAPAEVKALLPLAQLGIRAVLGRSLEDALYEIVAGPVVFGLVPGDGKPLPLLALRVQDEGSARRLIDKFMPKVPHAFEDGLLLISQKPEGIDMLRAGGEKKRTYDRSLHLHLDMAALRKQQDGGNLLDGLDPFGRFVIGPLVAVLDASETVDVIVQPEEGQLTLQARADGRIESPMRDLLAVGGERSIPAAPKGTVAFVTLDRSLAALFREMDRLLSEEQAVQAKSFLSIANQILGASFDEDLLTKLREPMHFYVIDMGPSDEYGPHIQLPSFVLVAELRDEEAAEKVLSRGAQGLFFVANIGRAQSGDKALRKRALKRGTVAEYPDWEGVGAPPTEYGLSPCLLFAHGHAILASTQAGAEAMAESLGSEEKIQLQGDMLRLYGLPLAQVLERNFELLQLNRVLDEGDSMQAAGRFLRALGVILGAITEASIQATLEPEHTEWILELRRR